MRLRFTYNSNVIEGNTLTMYETKAVLEDGITIAGKSLKEHLEVVGHSHAIDYLESLVHEDAPLRAHPQRTAQYHPSQYQ